MENCEGDAEKENNYSLFLFVTQGNGFHWHCQTVGSVLKEELMFFTNCD